MLGLILCLILSFSPAALAQQNAGEAMRLSSPAFADGQEIPVKYTCRGENVSPRLDIEDIPANAESLALIVDDPDAPGGVWSHWVVYDMAPLNSIAEGSAPGRHGSNDFGNQRYDGPCPPSGSHRYFYKVYALDTKLNLAEGKSQQEVEEAMRGHVLGEAELVGIVKH